MDHEFAALTKTSGVLDFSTRSRLCLLGEDRVKFLQGQVTNDIAGLDENTGCYAVLVNAKGKMESDLFVYRLADAILIDFEPGMTDAVKSRLEKFIITEAVEVANAAPHFGLLSVQGPTAVEVVGAVNLPVPEAEWALEKTGDEIYIINQPRLGSTGFDLFVPVDLLGKVQGQLLEHAPLCRGVAFEKARVLATIPRFGIDLTSANLPPEGGLEARAISYAKGCYIGQEVIARIRTYGQVNRMLRGLQLDGEAEVGDVVLHGEKKAGVLSSVSTEPDAALALIRREANALGTPLRVETKNGSVTAEVATLPFEKFAL